MLKEPKPLIFLDSEIKFIYPRGKKRSHELLIQPHQAKSIRNSTQSNQTHDVTQRYTTSEKKLSKSSIAIPKERELHHYLAKFAFEQLDQTFVKTIHHERSTQSAYQSWVHPDLVGVSFPFMRYHGEVIDLAHQLGVLGQSMVKLYAFELKRELTFSNLRESFFQTVSNASWANYSYLVTAQIPDQLEFHHELQRLSQSFQVGVIVLNIEDLSLSKILFPAVFKSQLDWQTVNKLAEENPDFRKFLYCINRDVKAKKVYKEDYDSFS